MMQEKMQIALFDKLGDSKLRARTKEICVLLFSEKQGGLFNGAALLGFFLKSKSHLHPVRYGSAKHIEGRLAVLRELEGEVLPVKATMDYAFTHALRVGGHIREIRDAAVQIIMKIYDKWGYGKLKPWLTNDR